MPDGKIQLRIDEPLDSRFAIELPAVRLEQGLFDFLPDVFASRRYRKGSSRPPKPYPHRSSKNNARRTRTQMCCISYQWRVTNRLVHLRSEPKH